MTFFITILIIGGLIYLLTKKKGSQKQTKASNQEGQFESNIPNLVFPDRTDAIKRHSQAIKKCFQNGDLDLANLSYAKLIESVRQQNVNTNGKFDSVFEQIKEEYKLFRTKFDLDYPEQFLPPSHRKKGKKNTETNGLVNISSHTKGNTTTMSIDLNEEELLRRIENGDIRKIEHPNDEYTDDIVEFYSTENFSQNKKFCVVYSDGHYKNDKWENGQFAVMSGKKLLFKKRLERPSNCHISNNGISICCDWLNTDDLAGKFIAFDQTGKQIFSKKTTANLGSSGISNDGKVAIFETYNSNTEDANQIFVVNLKQGTIESKFDRPIAFIKTDFNTEKGLIKLIDNRNFTFEIDYKGNQTNKDEYEAQILEKGSIYDKLWFYSDMPDEIKFKEKNYLDLLFKATKDKDTQYSFGLDRLYRMIGEYYEANNETTRTIEYWEKAIEINSKVGVKRKLNKLKSKK